MKGKLIIIGTLGTMGHCEEYLKAKVNYFQKYDFKYTKTCKSFPLSHCSRCPNEYHFPISQVNVSCIMDRWMRFTLEQFELLDIDLS